MPKNNVRILNLCNWMEYGSIKVLVDLAYYVCFYMRYRAAFQ